jgi:tRNA A-37 threonylcarbamoyl transferase component Bud32
MSLHPMTTRNIPSGRQGNAGLVVRVRRAREDWLVHRQDQARLLGPEAPDWFAIKGDPRLREVKKGRDRSIFRVELGAGVVYVKASRPSGWRERCKQLLLGGPAEREWRVSRRAHELGVPAVRCLAVGVQAGSPKQGVLLTEELGDGETLADAWEGRICALRGGARRREARKLIDAVARLFAAAHRAGFFHRDAHPTNILVKCEGGEYEAVFADLHGARIRGGDLEPALPARSLAHLDQYFHRRATRTERLRFSRQYLAHWQGRPATGLLVTPGRERAWLNTLSAAATAHRRALAAQRDRRLKGNGKYFARIRLTGGWTAVVALELERRHVFPEDRIPDRSEADWRAILEPLLTRAGADEPVDAPAVSKEIRGEIETATGMVERVLWTLRGSPSRLAFERCHRLRHRDRYSPLLLAVAEHRSAGLMDRTVLLAPGATKTDGDECGTDTKEAQ